MRAALIGLAPAEGDRHALLGGRRLAEHQLDFALHCGAEMVILHAIAAQGMAISLRHRAEAAGMRFMVITSAHALIGAIGPGDELLVLHPGLLPLSPMPAGLLAEQPGVLALPGDMATRAGFERIDLALAFAGALVMPGAMLSRLSQLPEDCEPAPALLRIALQAGVPVRDMPVTLCETGEWVIVAAPKQMAQAEQLWLRRLAGPMQTSALGRMLAGLALQSWGGVLAALPRNAMLLGGGLALLLAGAIAGVWLGYAWLAFVLFGLAAVLGEVLLGLLQLRAAPFGRFAHEETARRGFDLALLASAIMLTDGLWYRAVFPPLVLLAALELLSRVPLPNAAAGLADRAALAFSLALLVLVLPVELAMMVVAAMVLAACLAFPARSGG